MKERGRETSKGKGRKSHRKRRIQRERDIGKQGAIRKEKTGHGRCFQAKFCVEGY